MANASTIFPASETWTNSPSSPIPPKAAPQLLIQAITPKMASVRETPVAANKMESTTTLITYRKKNRLIEASTAMVSGLPSNFTANSILGCSTRFSSTMVMRTKTTNRAILMPPAVEPAHPPVKYKSMSVSLATAGHCS